MSDRPTKKDRRELAKQARIEAERRARRAAARRRITSTLVLLFIVAGIVGLFVFQSKRNADRANRLANLAQELGCGEVQTFDFVGTGQDGSAVHVPEGEVTYDRMPPEAGDHRPSWAKTGVHPEPLETEFSTHNLEHGAVLVQYKETVSEEVRTALNDAVLGNPQWSIAAPYDEFNQDQVLSMTAWEVRLDCPKTTAPQAAQFGELARLFIAAHLDNAPESVPGEVLSPEDAEDEELTSPTPSEDASDTPSESPSESPSEPETTES